MTQILITSASGANGDGYGAVLSFTADGGPTRPFSQDRRISDPRGLSLDPFGELIYLNSGADRVLALDRNGEVALDSGRIDGLDPGGGTFGPDGRYYVGLRRRRTILALPARLDRAGEPLLPDGIVAFPRGFGFSSDGDLYLASGVGPAGVGENTIAVFDQWGALCTPRLVDDPRLTRSISQSRPTGISWSPASGPTEPATRCRASANTSPPQGGSSGCSRPTRRWGSPGRVVCGSGPTVASIVLAETRSLHLTSPPAGISKLSRDSHD